MNYIILADIQYKTDSVEISNYYYYTIMGMACIGFVAIVALIVLIIKNHSDWGYISKQKTENAKIGEEYVKMINTTKSNAKGKDKKIFQLEDKVKQLEREVAYWKQEYYNNKVDTNELANAIRDGIAKARYEEKNGIFGSADDMFNRK